VVATVNFEPNVHAIAADTLDSIKAFEDSLLSMTTRNQNTMLTLGFLATLNVHLLLFSYSPLVPDIANELKLTSAEAGFLFSVSILTLMVFRVPWGILFDRRGFKKNHG
jgi:MFS family permease